MNKYKLVLLLITIVLLSGCETGKLKCTSSYDDNIKYTVKIDAKIKNKKIESSTARMKFDKKDDATGICELKNLSSNKNVNITCYEKEIVIKNYHFLEMNGSQEEITKTDFVKQMQKQGFKCK